jgi:alpha-1,3-rhamnosyl/mannosyltransferase
MHLAIDAREAFRAMRTGKGQWARGFIEELVTHPVSLTLFFDVLPSEDFSRYPHVTMKVVSAPGILWHVRVASMLRAMNDIDAYVSPTSYIVPFLLGCSKNCITIIHDLIAFRDEPHDRRATVIERLLLGRVVRSSAILCTVSEHTRHDLLERYPVLRNGFVKPIFAGPLRPFTPLSKPDGKTILCIATLCPRKNQKRLIEAFRILPDHVRVRHRLLLVGARGWNDEEILTLASSTPGVEWKSYVSDDTYEELLSRATIFALPSLYEGFGMQILDALQHGIPVLTSDRGSLPEVTGDAAVLVDPENVTSIAVGLRKLLEDSHLRDRLRRNGPLRAANFSWKKTVDLFLGALENMDFLSA